MEPRVAHFFPAAVGSQCSGQEEARGTHGAQDHRLLGATANTCTAHSLSPSTITTQCPRLVLQGLPGESLVCQYTVPAPSDLGREASSCSECRCHLPFPAGSIPPQRPYAARSHREALGTREPIQPQPLQMQLGVLSLCPTELLQSKLGDVRLPWRKTGPGETQSASSAGRATEPEGREVSAVWCGSPRASHTWRGPTLLPTSAASTASPSK